MSVSERMQIFAKVVEQGGMTAAALVLGCGKAHVSQQIRRLETDLGARLLHRTTRKVVLTEAGQLFYHHCRQLVETVARAQSELAELGATAAGEVRLTAPRTLGEHLLTPFLSHMALQYPSISLTVNLSNTLLDFHETNTDLGLRFCDDPPEDLVAKPLGVCPEAVCASPEYLNSITLPTHPSHLSELACLTLNPPARRAKEWLFYQGSAVISVPITARFRCSSYVVLRDLARQGHGVAIVPEYLLTQCFADGSHVQLLPSILTRTDPLYLLYPAMAHRPAKVKLVIEQLRGWFGSIFSPGDETFVDKYPV